jgi:hypothetical protein
MLRPVDIVSVEACQTLDIPKHRTKLMHMPSEIPILSQSRPSLKARAQNLIQMPVSPSFEVHTGKPSLPHASLSDHLIYQNPATRALQLFR